MAKQMPPGTYYGDIPKGGYQNVTWTDWEGNPVDAGWIEPEVEGEDYHGYRPVDEFGVVIPDSKPLPFKAMPRIDWNWLPEAAGFGEGGPARPIQDPNPDHIGQIVNPYTVGRTLRYYDWNDPDSLQANPFLTDYFKSQFHPDIAKFLPAYSEHNLMREHTGVNPGDAELLTSMLEGYNPWTTDEAVGWPDPSQAWTNLAPREKDPLKVDPLQAPQDMGQKAAEVNWGMIMRLPPRLKAYMMEQYVDADREERHGHLEALGLDPKDAPGWEHEGRPGAMGGWNPGVPEDDPPGGGGGNGPGDPGPGDPGPGDPGPGDPGPGPPGPLPNPGRPNPYVPFDAWPGYPNINYPGRNDTYDAEGNLIPGYPQYQYAHTGRQPDPMWGGGPQTWSSGYPVSNTWSGGMQPLMANDPWALSESGVPMGMLPPTMGNFFGGYWDANYPLTPQRDPTRFGDPYSESSPWGPGWQEFDVESDPRVGNYYDPKRPTQDVEWGDVPYIGWENYKTGLPRPNWAGGTFMDRAGVTQQQYNLAQDPGAWRGGQTFGQRTGMNQEAYNASRNAADQRQTAAAQQSRYGQPVQGPGQFGGAYGTFDPTTEFGQQGGEPGDAFARQMGVTQQQYNLAQNPGAWRGDQSFGERVGMSQEAYNTARNRAGYGQAVQGPGQFGGAYGTFGPGDVGSGMVHPSQRALPSPTQTAQPEPVPQTPFFGAPSMITPGTLGGMGTPANFNASSITPGRLGGGNMYGNQRRGF